MTDRRTLLLSAAWAGLGLVLAPALPAFAGGRAPFDPAVAERVKKFMAGQFGYDPAFLASVAKPSPWLTDFFGLQAIRDLPLNRIAADLPKLGATVEKTEGGAVHGRLAGGQEVVFRPNTTMNIMGIDVPIGHAEVMGATWQEVGAGLEALRGAVASASLEADYFIPNAVYDSEKTAAELFAKTTEAGTITVDPDLAAFAADANGVLLLPEPVHGIAENAAPVRAAMKAAKLDWLGLEMLSAEQQPLLDAFFTAGNGTKEHDEARAGLLAYFANSWNGRAGPKVPPEELYYFQLVDEARNAGTRIVALENVPMEFFFFRYGETPFGAAVRNDRWVRAAPETGRGAIFGGSAHFRDPQATNVQDFYRVLRPSIKLYATAALEPKKAQ